MLPTPLTNPTVASNHKKKQLLTPFSLRKTSHKRQVTAYLTGCSVLTCDEWTIVNETINVCVRNC